MRQRLLTIILVALAVGVLSGCEPAPSTELAPDKPAPDASKMTPEEMDKLLKSNHENDMKRR